ncbi:MAG: hypothetical protein ACOCWG_02265 [bacterium]
MENKNCVVCGSEIEHTRKGKKYCSENCKNKAYNERKIEAKKSEIEVLKDKGIEILYTFKTSEFERVSKKMNLSSPMDFETYCFFRKNLSINVSDEFIIDYLQKITTDYNSQPDIEKAHHEFMFLFHSGKVRIVE